MRKLLALCFLVAAPAFAQLSATLTGIVSDAQLPQVNLTPGTYTNATVTVDAWGRVISAQNGTGGGGGGGATLGANTFTGTQTLISGTAAIPSLTTSSGAMAIMSSISGGSVLFGANGGIYGGVVGTAGFEVRSSGAYNWTNTGNVPATIDTSLIRKAAGVVEVSSNYVGGSARDISARHYWGAGPSPTVGGCGDAPTISGKDAFFKITVGANAASCIAVFGTAYATAPVCVANAEITTTPLNISTTTTTVTVASQALTGGEVLHVVCGTF